MWGATLYDQLMCRVIFVRAQNLLDEEYSAIADLLLQRGYDVVPVMWRPL